MIVFGFVAFRIWTELEFHGSVLTSFFSLSILSLLFLFCVLETTQHFSDFICLNTLSLLNFKNLFLFLTELLRFTKMFVTGFSIFIIPVPIIAVASGPALFFGVMIGGILIYSWLLLLIPIFIPIPFMFSPSFSKITNKEVSSIGYSKLVMNIVSVILFWIVYFNIFHLILSLINSTFLLLDLLPLSSFLSTSLHISGSLSWSIAVFWIAVYKGGGHDLIDHFIMRAILIKYDRNYWNLEHFFDYCTERLILQRVGNRYRFIHRLVQEHFANLEIQKK